LEAGATLRVGTYNLNDDLEPTTLIEDYGTMDASSTGTKTIVGAAPVVGRFAVAAWASNHATVRYQRGNVLLADGHLMFGDATPYAGNYGYCWGVNSVDYSGGLPATAPAVTIQGATTNLIMPAVSIS
jgi:prepilin-type processing-associated H-X9-DG protein